MSNVTIFKDFSDTQNPHLLPVDEVLQFIKTGRWRDKIEQIRSCGDKEQASLLKKALPCVLYAGEFTVPVPAKNGGMTCRKDESLAKHSHLVPIDIDDIDNPDDVIAGLKSNQFVHALWKSPSGRGVHGLVRIGDGKKHRKHYNALITWFKGMLDTTARNESRILFASYDPDLYINNNSSVFYDVEDDPQDKAETGIAITGSGYTDYSKINTAVKMIRLAPDGEKHNILLKASVLMGGYIAVGKIEKEIAEAILFHEINKRNIIDVGSAQTTIKDGIVYGMTRPISETEDAYNEATMQLMYMEDETKFLSNPDEDEVYIRKFRSGLIEMGKGFGYDELDEYLLLKEAEFYAFIAHSNIGKTTFIMWLMLCASVRYNWNWLVYVGENNPASMKMRLIESLCGKRIREISERWLRFALRFVNEHFFFIKNDKTYTYKEVLEYAEIMSHRKSVKGLFIDPYNALRVKLTPGMTKHQWDYEAYTDMLSFITRTQMTLFLSAHTNTEGQRALDKDGHQQMPHATMVEGGVPLYNKVHNFVTIHRRIKDPERWMYTEISIDKVRNKETGGSPTMRGRPVVLCMNKGIEFIDENGHLPFDRDFLPSIEEEE